MRVPWSAVVALVLAVSWTWTWTGAEAQECPNTGSSTTTGGRLEIAGSSSVKPIARAWAELLDEKCPGWVVNVREGGSEAGARQVCDQNLIKASDDLGDDITQDEFAVDIADMSRSWVQPLEASAPFRPWLFSCAHSTRKVIQIVVAYDSLTLAVAKNSTAAACIRTLTGGGLTIHQIRWMYSSLTETELLADGWVDELKGESNNNVTSRTWAKLGGLSTVCPDEPILIAGPDDDSETQNYFREKLFTGTGETFATDRSYVNSADNDVVLAYLVQNPTAIGFFGYNYAVTAGISNSLETLAIQNAETKAFVPPSFKSISAHVYVPFSRPIYMNVHDDATALVKVNPFIALGFSTAGQALVRAMGYVPISHAERLVGLTRLGAEGGVPRYIIQNSCPSVDGGAFTMAGSSTVFPLAELWAGVYQVFCNTTIRVEGGGSSRGACRVCGQCDASHEDEEGRALPPAEIGDMSRNWIAGMEANSINGYMYDCAQSDRKVTQIEVAIDGLSVVTASSGIAHECIEALGGLTRDQLRWIFSSFTTAELQADGWVESSVPFLDTDDKSHLWSELSSDPRCPAVEIKIAGADSYSGTYDYMVEYLFNTAKGETFDLNRPLNATNPQDASYFFSSLDDDIVEYLQQTEAGIGYFGYAYVASNTDTLDPVAIRSPNGYYVKPEPTSIESGDYPMARRIYMNVLEDVTLEAYTVPFMNFALSEEGQNLVRAIGLSTIPAWQNHIMHARLDTEFSKDFSAIEWSKEPGNVCGKNGFSIAGSSTVLPIAQLWAGMYSIACNVTVDVAGGGSTAGAARVCAADASETPGGVDLGGPVEIGDLSREWKPWESTPVVDGCRYQCAFGDKSRQTIRVQVATDGLTIAVADDGDAHNCIKLLNGLSVDQLRWIYSDLTANQLKDDGWDASSVPGLDNDDQTHLWSELDSRCASTEIKISGTDKLSGTSDYFAEVVFKKPDESFDTKRPSPYFNSPVDELLVDYLSREPAAISFFGFTYYFSSPDLVAAVPIVNPYTKIAVMPTTASIFSKQYTPFSRPIYMNLLLSSLNDTLPFIEYGLSKYGTELVEFTGYVAQTGVARREEITCLVVYSGDNKTLSPGAIAGIVLASVFSLCCLYGLCLLRNDGPNPVDPAKEPEEKKASEEDANEEADVENHKEELDIAKAEAA
ncbi:hypothetical protein ACA910_018720 [Epithemia clementina (nom. ined.)]